jgi:hypothetical protein
MYDADYVTSALSAILGILSAAILIPIILIGIGLYVLQAYGLYTMAKRRGVENAWLAFIPVANLYIIGLLVGEVQVGSLNLDSKLFLPIGAVVSGVLSLIPLIGFLVAIAFQVFYYMVLYKLYKAYNQENAVLYTVLSILFGGIAMPVIFFMIRNNEPNIKSPDYDQHDIFNNPNVN